MAYIGRNPAIGTQKVLDSLESQFNGTLTTFNLRYNTNTIYPTLASSLIVSLGGVLQEPGTAYNVSSDQIVFATAPPVGTDCWILLYSEFGGQAGATSNLTVSNNLTIGSGGEIHGPSTLVLDPAAVGNNTGTVEIKGNLTVQGTQTTINSTTVDLDHLALGDNEKFTLGAGGTGDNGGATEEDLQIYSDGSNLYFDSAFITTSGSPAVATSPNIYFRTSKTTTLDKNALTILNDGKVGIGTATPSADLEISGTAGTSSTLFINAPDHSSTTASEATLKFGYSHSGSPGAVAEIKLIEGSTNSFGGHLVFKVPNNNQNGGSSTTEALRINASGNVGIGNDASFPVYTDSSDTNLIIGVTGNNANDSAIQLHSGNDKYGGVYFGDSTSGADRYRGYIEYKHDADNAHEEFLRLAAAGGEKLRLAVNDGNAASPVATFGSNFSTHLNNNSSNDRASFKVGGHLHLEGGYGSNHFSGLYYNCTAFGQKDFYQGTFAANSFDNRACALTMAYGHVYFYTDHKDNTNYSVGSQITTMTNTMHVGNGIVTIPTGNLRLGQANTNTLSSIDGNISAFESLNFSIDSDNDDTNRSFNWYKNAEDNSGTLLLNLDESGHLTPGSDDTQDLGSSSKRWRNIYTGDLQLSNEGSSNDVDGTWGKYTIQEGEEELFIINRRTGKKFKFVLEEVN